MKQKAIPPITLTAGQRARLTFNITVPDGTAIPTLIGALTVRNQRVDMTTDGSSALIIPPLPPGVHLAEVRAGGTCILYGHIEVLPSPLSNTTGIQDYTVDIDMTADVLTVNLTLAGGPAGEPGASAYQIWLNDGNSGTETDFLADLVGPAGDPGPQGETGPQGDPGETGPAPAHEWQGTSLRFKNSDGTWGSLVDLQGPQGPAGTGGGTITIDDTPTEGSSNAVSSGGVYAALLMPGSGTNSTAVGPTASAKGSYSTAVGPTAEAIGYYSTALGYSASARDSSSTAVGPFASASVSSSTALGFAASASGYYSTALGYSASARGSYSTAVGPFAEASGDVSAAVGFYASAIGSSSTAVGTKASAISHGASVFGSGGYIGDTGVTALNAGGSMTEGKSTQLYLIPAGSTMASNYTNGEAGLGYVVLDHLSGSVVARGTISLASICTQHTSDFSPIDVTSIQLY